MAGATQHLPHAHVPHGGQPGVPRHRGHSKRHREGETRVVFEVIACPSVGSWYISFAAGTSLPPRYFGCMVLVGAILKLLARDSQRWRGRARSRRPVPKPTDSNPTLNETCLPLVCRSWGSRPLSRREENSGLPLTTTRTRAYRSDPLPLPRLSSPKPPGGRSRRHPARHERPICRASDPVSIIFRELSVPRTYIAYRSVCSLRYGAREHAG